MAQLVPDFYFTHIPFASSINLELHSHADDRQKLYVKLIYNGMHIKDKSCGKLCTVDQFIDWVNSKLIIGNDPLIKELCNLEPQPDDYKVNKEKIIAQKLQKMNQIMDVATNFIESFNGIPEGSELYKKNVQDSSKEGRKDFFEW